MLAFIKKYGGYVLHAAAVVAVFLDPSVQAYAASHHAYAAGILLAWGFLLHYLNGK